MHEHIEILLNTIAARLRRDRRRPVGKHGPRKPRGTFVPVIPERPAGAPAPSVRLAH